MPSSSEHNRSGASPMRPSTSTAHQPVNGSGDPESRSRQLELILQRISGVDPAQIRPEARLIEDIGIDSLGFYEILIEADECLGIKIPEEELLKFRTVGDIQTYLRNLENPDAQTS